MPYNGTLICLDGPNKGSEVILNRDTLVVGRSPHCDIVLDDKFASRHHATIMREGNFFYVVDRGSKNGMTINHRQVEPSVRAVLSDGDIVTFAQTRFRFVDPSATMTNLELDHSASLESLHLHPATRQVLVNGIPLSPPLSLKQFELLECLYVRRGQAVSKDEIALAVWPDEIDPIPDSNIDRLVSRVRQRLAAAGNRKQYISTVRGFGFKLEADLDNS